jgi:hypothetical protein
VVIVTGREFMLNVQVKWKKWFEKYRFCSTLIKWRRLIEEIVSF